LDWMRKFNFLDDEKVNREKEKKSKLVIAHLYFITFFLRIFIQMFLLVYSTIKIRDAQRLLLHLQPRKDQLKSFQYRLQRLQSQLVILHCEMLVERKDKALVDFVLIDFKNDTCDREEDFAAI